MPVELPEFCELLFSRGSYVHENGATPEPNPESVLRNREAGRVQLIVTSQCSYPSGLADSQWERLRPLFETDPLKGGAPRTYALGEADSRCSPCTQG